LKDKFTISISDVNGSKHYVVSQIIKKIFGLCNTVCITLFLGSFLFKSNLKK